MSGVATGAGTRVDVTLKLSQLQNLCKRDPAGYKEDYDAQVRRLDSECKILGLSADSASKRLEELIQFCAAVSSSSYKQEVDMISSLLIDLLSNNMHHLHRDIRKACVSALILMRNKGAVEPLKLMELFFRCMSTVSDKALRELLYKHMVNDICNMNKKGKRQEKVNRSVQAFLHKVVSADDDTSQDDSATSAKRATDIVCELYRRQVWTDQRTVAILASAVLSKQTTVACRAMRFFLNIEEKMLEDEKRRQEDEWSAVNQIDYHKFSRKTAVSCFWCAKDVVPDILYSLTCSPVHSHVLMLQSRKRHVARQLKNRKKAQQKKENSEWMDMEAGVDASKKLYPAIELLHDPQGLAEAVFKKLRSGNSYPYEVKLLMMNFVTRLVGNHELLVLPLYPFLQRYMGGHQRDVTAVLAYTVQACHEYVPPEEVFGILKTIAHNFITERCSGEQMAVGINAARAICARVPSALSVEEEENAIGVAMDVEAFVRDLAAYSNHRDRSVSIAGKAWTNFIRQVHPSLLQGKDRGLAGSALHRAGEKPLRYGQSKVSAGVEGADLLAEYESKKAAFLRKQNASTNANDDDDDDDGIHEVPMNEEADGEEWVDVEEESDDEAPNLVRLKSDPASDIDETQDEADDEGVIDLSKMTPEEREELTQKVSATRVFTAADFEKMRKLVEREKRAKQDPREAARRKRAAAKGKEFEELSDESDADSDDEQIHTMGAVNPVDIMAEAKRKRQTKAEKLEKVVAGRQKFEAKSREGGSTNEEKRRKKNFLMSKMSWATRSKGKGKETARKANKRKQTAGTHDAKKRRRKL